MRALGLTLAIFLLLGALSHFRGPATRAPVDSWIEPEVAPTKPKIAEQAETAPTSREAARAVSPAGSPKLSSSSDPSLVESSIKNVPENRERSSLHSANEARKAALEAYLRDELRLTDEQIAEYRVIELELFSKLQATVRRDPGNVRPAFPKQALSAMKAAEVQYIRLMGRDGYHRFREFKREQMIQQKVEVR